MPPPKKDAPPKPLLGWLAPYLEGGMDLLRGATGLGDQGPPGPTWTNAGALLAAAAPFAPGKLTGLKALATGEQATEAALDLSHAARMQRAAEQGYDVSKPLYHGTTYDFPEFKPGRRSVYLTDDPAIADIYARGQHSSMPKPNAGPNVLPVYARAKKPLIVSDLGPDGGGGWFGDNAAAALGISLRDRSTLYEEARRQGYDLVVMKDMMDLGGRQTQYIPLQPEYVRSRFAAFDPRHVASGNLLAGIGGGGILLSQLAPRQPEPR